MAKNVIKLIIIISTYGASHKKIHKSYIMLTNVYKQDYFSTRQGIKNEQVINVITLAIPEHTQ